MTTYYLSPAGNDSNSGTGRGSGSAWQTISHAAGVVAAGDTVKILGVAGDAASYPTSSLDYTIPSFIFPMTAGDTTSGYIRWVADETGPMPTISCPGLTFHSPSYNTFEGLYLVATGNSLGGYGIILAGGPLVMRGCVVNAGNQSGQVGVSWQYGEISGSEFYGGSMSPSQDSGSHLIVSAGYNSHVAGNYVHHSRDCGIYDSPSGTLARNNIISACAGDGIRSANTGIVISLLDGNTVNGNGGHGLSITGTAGVASVVAINNILTSNGGYGLSVSDGSTGTNDARKRLCDYNWFGSGGAANTSGSRANISAGAHDLSGDPQYVGGGDWTPTNALVKAAFPASFSGTGTTNYGWIGAVQPDGSGGGGGPTYSSY